MKKKKSRIQAIAYHQTLALSSSGTDMKTEKKSKKSKKDKCVTTSNEEDEKAHENMEVLGRTKSKKKKMHKGCDPAVDETPRNQFNETDQDVFLNCKKSKKKKKKNQEAEIESAELVAPESENIVKKKKKKKDKVKNSDGDDDDNDNDATVKLTDVDGTKFKSKKKKRKVNENEGHEKTDEPEKKKVRFEIEESVEDCTQASKMTKKKKKKSKKLESQQSDENGIVNDSNIISDDGLVDVPSKKKKKKKDGKSPGSCVNELTIDSEASQDLDGVNESDIKPKQKKKKRKHKEVDEDEECADEGENGLSKKKKKKRKKDSKESNPEASIITNDPETTNSAIHNSEARSNVPVADLNESKLKPLSPQLNGNVGQWKTASFNNNQQQQKFFRLLGGFKKSDASPSSVVGGSPKAGLFKSLSGTTGNVAMSANQQAAFNTNMEEQFEKARSMAVGKQRGGGLGFTAPPGEGKKFYIDTSNNKSMKFY